MINAKHILAADVKYSTIISNFLLLGILCWSLSNIMSAGDR